MKAVRLHGIGDLRVEERPKPRPAARELVVKTAAAFICGTDVRMYRSGALNLPITLGHELAGTIDSVGGSVEHYRPGMRVAVAPNFGCGVCDFCVSGHTELCRSMEAIGISRDGGFAEYFVVPERGVLQGNVTEIADNLSFQEAALAEPLSCVLNSFERCRTEPGNSVLVIGAGPIGLMHAKLHRLAGAGVVMIHDLNEDRLERCRADDRTFVTVGPRNPRERVLELTGGAGADIVITATSAPETQQLAFEVAAVNGRVVFFGGLPTGAEPVSLDTNIIHYRMITVTGTSRQSLRQYRRCLTLIAQGIVDVRGTITKMVPLAQGPEAMESVVRGEGLKTGFLLS